MLGIMEVVLKFCFCYKYRHTMGVLIPSGGGSRIFEKGRSIERRGIATAHGHRTCWCLPPPFEKGEAAVPQPPKSATAYTSNYHIGM